MIQAEETANFRREFAQLCQKIKKHILFSVIYTHPQPPDAQIWDKLCMTTETLEELKLLWEVSSMIHIRE